MAIYTNTDLVVICLRSYVLPAYILYRWGLFGLGLYVVVLVCYYKMLKYVFGLETLAMLDEFFLLDNSKNRSNIITVVKLDKIQNYEEFRKFVIKRATQYPRTRHSLKKFISEYFFSELNEAELLQAIDSHFIRNDKIKNKEDICNFVSKEQATRDPLTSLQYKFVFVPDYSD